MVDELVEGLAQRLSNWGRWGADDQLGALNLVTGAAYAHLGAMPMSVAAVVNALELREGDIAILNDPFAGGTHLPDITLVLPIFVGGKSRPAFYAASRAHHSDIGGMYAGSMGPAREIYQ